jgi:hypothetical protein
MSREVRRVPIDFDWPMHEIWPGYQMPREFIGPQCPDCPRRPAGVDPCPTCSGFGTTEEYEGQHADYDAWTETDPPTGDGWQLWETVSEGSPVTPVFPTAAGLIGHLVAAEGYRESAARRLVTDGESIGSFVVTGGRMYDSAKDADLIAERLGRT